MSEQAKQKKKQKKNNQKALDVVADGHRHYIIYFIEKIQLNEQKRNEKHRKMNG